MRGLSALAAVICLQFVAPAPASAQVGGLQMSGSRPFGILLGEVFTLKTRFDVVPPFKLDQASLPKPGAMTYWLDLRTMKLEESAAPSGGTRYDLTAEYQTFYAPLEAIEQTVPPFRFAVVDDKGKRVESESARWTFLTSPLRPVVAAAGGGASAYGLRPDAAPVRKSLRPAEITAAAAAGAVLLAALALAWSRAWPPFHARPSRPFARAARAVAGQARAGEEGWKAAALMLHRAFDVAAGRRLLGDDLPAFLSDRPAFRRHEAAISSFFEASRQAFFGGRTQPESADLTRLARDLAAAERAT